MTSLAEPHTALGYTLAEEWDWMGAQKEFQRALELDPGYVIGLYQYAFYLSVMGKHDEAIPVAQKALDLDPLSPIVLYRAGRVQFQARHYPEAEELFRRILELDVSDPLGLYGQGMVYEARRKIWLGNFLSGKAKSAAGLRRRRSLCRIRKSHRSPPPS